MDAWVQASRTSRVLPGHHGCFLTCVPPGPVTVGPPIVLETRVSAPTVFVLHLVFRTDLQEVLSLGNPYVPNSAWEDGFT